MRILMIGDIVGKGGRHAVAALVPELRRELACDFCVTNGENMAGGAGITEKCLKEMNGAGVDVFTGGDHIWDQHDFIREIDHLPGVLRPANLHAGQPGRGWGLFPVAAESAAPRQILVLCLQGRVFMNYLSDCPFQAAVRVLEETGNRLAETPVLVDFHAEATSEKIAMGRWLDGRVSAVLGTHTHVPTADEQIFPGGTAFQTDVGMVGARDSILGRAVTPVLQRFTTGLPASFKVVEKGIRLQATVVDIDDNTGKALDIRRICRDFK